MRFLREVNVRATVDDAYFSLALPLQLPVQDEVMRGHENVSDFHDGLSAGSVNGKFGYYDRQGKEIIAPEYDHAGPFCEGLACVSKRNEFGQVRYGFIDKKGNVVIPLRMVNQPRDFSGGLAYADPVNKTEFHFAFLKRSGEVIFKQTEGMPVSKPPKFHENYFQISLPASPWEKLKIIDTSGRESDVITKNRNMIRPVSDGHYGGQFPEISRHIQRFNYKDENDETNAAFLNLLTGEIDKTSYDYLSSPDPASGIMQFSRDNQEGFIDSHGKVIIIRSDEKSEF